MDTAPVLALAELIVQAVARPISEDPTEAALNAGAPAAHRRRVARVADLLRAHAIAPAFLPSATRLGLADYERSREIPNFLRGVGLDLDDDFYAVLAALMRVADTGNLERLSACWPLVRADLQERYDAPGGLLPHEHEAVALHREHFGRGA